MHNVELSIVLCGRNDNRGGNFDQRAERAIRHNAALLSRHNILYELIWVEWNPLIQRAPLLKQIQNWAPGARTFIVSSKIHQRLCLNKKIGLMQFHAKNVGLRRARGNWLLAMNADTYLTKEIVSRLQTPDQLDTNTLYLATRIDIASDQLNASTPTEFPLDFNDVKAIREDTPDLINTFGSAGDFTLIKKEHIERLQGYYEGIRFSNAHIDSLLCQQVLACEGTIKLIGNVYHVDHVDSWLNLTDGHIHHHGIDYSWKDIPTPYKNIPEWGLSDCNELLMEENIIELQAGESLACETFGSDEQTIGALTTMPFETLRTATAAQLRSLHTKVLILGNNPPHGLHVVSTVATKTNHRDGENELWNHIPDLSFDIALLDSAPNPTTKSPYPSCISVDKIFPYWPPFILGNDPRLWRRRHVLGVLNLLEMAQFRIVLWGAGKHTTWLLSFLRDANIQKRLIIVDDNPDIKEILGCPVIQPNTLVQAPDLALVLSTDSSQDIMRQALSVRYKRARIVDLYETLPRGPYLLTS